MIMDTRMNGSLTQLSHTVGASEPALLEETIGAAFDRIVAPHRDREALVDRASGRRWTYGGLAKAVDRLATGLLRAGISRGDRVGIWAANCPEWTFLQYATAKIGAILVTVNPAYEMDELRYVVNQSGMRMMVTEGSYRGADHAEMINTIRPDCPGLHNVVIIGTLGWEWLRVQGVDAPALAARAATLDPHDPINIQYTSGTTGHPKGATLTHHNILNNAYLVGQTCGYSAADRICVPVPLYHTFGMVIGNLGSMAHGACVVYPSPVFDPAATLAAVAEERCTSLYGVPTMFIAELGRPDFDSYDLSSLRTGAMGGSPCPVEVMRQVVDRMGMTDVTIVYGMTETSPVSTQTRVDDPLHRRVGTVGRVHPHLEIKIMDPVTGRTVPRGRPGELCTRGYSVMIGYWEQPEKTAEAIDECGWMHTGDLAIMDEEGYVNITGRIKDLIIRGGENISPREIEEFLYTHPAIQDAQVIGVPDARLGEEVMAWVQLRPGHPELTVGDLRAFAGGKLARHKIPRYLRLVEGFPMTVSGKVRKVEMRRIAVAELALADAQAVRHA
jgi:fatty-acyl-CoA synthase